MFRKPASSQRLSQGLVLHSFSVRSLFGSTASDLGSRVVIFSFIRCFIDLFDDSADFRSGFVGFPSNCIRLPYLKL